MILVTTVVEGEQLFITKLVGISRGILDMRDVSTQTELEMDKHKVPVHVHDVYRLICIDNC